MRGSATYDLLHMFAARKAGVEKPKTLEQRNFRAFAQPGDAVFEGP